jgi:VWFA-related protein
VAKEYGLSDKLAASKSELEDARRQIESLGQRLAQKEREAADLGRKAQDSERFLQEQQRLAELNKPVAMKPGTRAGIERVALQNAPLVMADVWVEDGAGAPLDGLQAKDFRATFDGNAVGLVAGTVASRSEKLALCGAVVVDTSGSMANALDATKDAGKKFLAALPDRAIVQVYAFSDKVVELCKPTADKAAAGIAIDRLHVEGQTALRRALDTAASALIAADPERRQKKFVVLLTDGRDNVGGPELEEILGRCQAEGIQIFPIGLKNADLDVPTLQRIATATGGRYLEAAGTKDLAGQFDQAATHIQRRGYRLAFCQPAGASLDGCTIFIGQGPAAMSLPLRSPAISTAR